MVTSFPARGSEFGATRPDVAVFVLLAFVVIFAPLAVDRSSLLDQQEYLEYFNEGASGVWLEDFTIGDDGPLAFTIRLLTEEFMWRAWTALVTVFVDPSSAVLATVVALNLLVISSTWVLARRTTALALWMLLPTAMAVTGLIQIRQGFAFAVLMFFALRLKLPLVGALMAALLHTSFAVPLTFAAVATVLLGRPRLAAIVAIIAAGIGAYVGDSLFEQFGGRRLLVYSVDDGATSINFVFGALICAVPAVVLLLRTRSTDHAINSLIVMHLGCAAFVCISFFIFPLGTARIAYFTQLFLIPVLGALIATWRQSLFVTGPTFVVLAYLGARAYIDGLYQYILSPYV